MERSWRETQWVYEHTLDEASSGKFQHVLTCSMVFIQLSAVTAKLYTTKYLTAQSCNNIP